MITLQDLLEDKRFSYLTLINPNVNLDRKLDSVETTEAPDVYNYIPKNTFLITTAMIYKDNQTPLGDLIKILSEFPIATLAIKISRFIGSLDDEIIKIANKYDFPLLVIPKDKTTGEVYRDVTSFLMDTKNEQLLFAFEVHKKFYNLALNNASEKNLIQSLAYLIKKPVLLVDPFGNISSHSLEINSDEYKMSVRAIVEGLSTREIKLKEPKRLSYSVESIDSFSIYPIKLSKYYPYYLFVLNKDDKKIDASENLAIEQAMLVIAFLLFKNLRISFTNLTGKDNKVREILNLNIDDIRSPNKLKKLGINFNLENPFSYQVILISVKHKDLPIKNYSFSVEWFTLVYEWFIKKLRHYPNVNIYPDKDNLRIILLLQNHFLETEKLIDYNEIISRTLMLKLEFGIGGTFTTPLGIKDSYYQAKSALENGFYKDNIDFIKYHHKLSLTDLITSLNISDINTFISDTLGPLAKPKDEYHKDLRNTLKIYLEYNCDASKTAKELFIHRNTVLYRIEKCHELLSDSICADKINLNLILALKMAELIEKEQSGNNNF